MIKGNNPSRLRCIVGRQLDGYTTLVDVVHSCEMFRSEILELSKGSDSGIREAELDSRDIPIWE